MSRPGSFLGGLSGQASWSSSRIESVKACISELSSEIDGLNDDALKARLRRKLSDLDDAIFDNDDWALPVAEGQMAIKMAILGRPASGQQELLNMFLCGSTDGKTAENHKSPMEIITGVKSPRYVAKGHKYSTQVPWNGQERTLLLRASDGDPSPQVLAWADAFLVFFDATNVASFESVARIFTKIERFKRVPDLPSMLVAVDGLPKASPHVVPDSQAQELADAHRDCVAYVKTNPYTGLNVNRLFHDMIHAVMAVVALPANRVGRLQAAAAVQSLSRAPTSNRGSEKDMPLEDVGFGRSIPLKQGLLRKMTSQRLSVSGANPSKRWVILTTGKLTYYHSLQDYMSSRKSGKTIPLAHASLKVPSRLRTSSRSDLNPDKKEKHLFIINTMKGGTWTFACKNQAELNEWATAIEAQIMACLNQNISAGVKNVTEASAVNKTTFHMLSPVEMRQLRAVEGNAQCADCGALDPTWAVLNHGTLICIQCSGIHRNLGVHISRVRSTELDDWNDEQLKMMLETGNKLFNSVYEANAPATVKPKPEDDSDTKQAFIQAKYAQRRYVQKLASQPGEALCDALLEDDLEMGLHALAQCNKASLAYADPESGATALHIAVMKNDHLWTQRLLWAEAPVNVKDKEDRFPLHYAYNLPTDDVASTLLQHGAIKVAKEEARKPLHLAHQRQPSRDSDLDEPTTPQDAGKEVNFFDSLLAETLADVAPSGEATPTASVSSSAAASQTPGAATPQALQRSPLDLNSIDEQALVNELSAPTPHPQPAVDQAANVNRPIQRIRHKVPQRRGSSPLSRMTAGQMSAGQRGGSSPTVFGSDSEV